MRGQGNGCSEDVKDTILLLLSYFYEKEELLFHYVECLTKDVELEDLPVTACIVVCGKYNFYDGTPNLILVVLLHCRSVLVDHDELIIAIYLCISGKKN